MSFKEYQKAYLKSEHRGGVNQGDNEQHLIIYYMEGLGFNYVPITQEQLSEKLKGMRTHPRCSIRRLYRGINWEKCRPPQNKQEQAERRLPHVVDLSEPFLDTIDDILLN